MAALVNITTSNASGENRKISFVIQDDEESRTSSQTTLAMQVRIGKSCPIFTGVSLGRVHLNPWILRPFDHAYFEEKELDIITYLFYFFMLNQF